MDKRTQKLMILDDMVRVTGKKMMDAMDLAAVLSDQTAARQVLTIAQEEFGKALRRFFDARAELTIA